MRFIIVQPAKCEALARNTHRVVVYGFRPTRFFRR